MRFTIFRLLAVAALTAVAAGVANAAPPSSCAHKFIGTWVYPGGVTTVAANGMAYPKCPMCVATQTWTCSGNTYLFSNSGPPGQFSATLIGPNTLSGSGTVATRVGGKRSPPKQDAANTQTSKAKQNEKPALARQAAAKSAGSSQRQSCSDITGTKGGPSRVTCPEPVAKKFATTTPAPTKPANAPSEKQTAAPQNGVPTAAQQAALAGSIIDEIGRVRSGQIAATPPATGASQEPPLDPVETDPHRFAPRPPAPEEGQPCVTYFENMRANFKRNAALCLKDHELMRSLTDMVEKETSTVEEINRAPITRNSVPTLFAHFDPLDPRWSVSGEHASPNCDLPLTVATQREAFMECARVYMCGMRAATCGLELAKRRETKNCLPISQACIEKNPVPQRMAADPTPPPYQPPDYRSAPMPDPPHRNSTITGPSGPGGGGSSGGVRSAQ